MNAAVRAVENGIRELGYRAIQRDYAFADVLAPSAPQRRVSLAAFTHSPASYRTAALAVVESDGREAAQIVDSLRALGAPILLVIEGDEDEVEVWQVMASPPHRRLEKFPLGKIGEFFDRKRNEWQPTSIHRAKALVPMPKERQLDFVDAGLLPAIEGEIHTKLNDLLVDVVADAKLTTDEEFEAFFKAVFRLLTAKILRDRRNPIARDWNLNDVRAVLRIVGSIYRLPQMPPTADNREVSAACIAVWDRIRNGISFSNISADDLAFVYENTLVTKDTRKRFGTHSTPGQVAEYIVRRLALDRLDANELKIYEPFAGAGVFLVSALRHLRDTLPLNWTDEQRHNFLVKRLFADEIEPFACEAATLSLILADYPNRNGWQIEKRDLFEKGVLEQRIREHRVILCNPPFEDFKPGEYRPFRAAAQTYSKPIAVLNAALDAQPLALGFVLPRSFILDKKFVEQRRRIERLFDSVELVALPDGSFCHSSVEAALLIATDRRHPASTSILLKSTEIADRDRDDFLKTAKTTTHRDRVKPIIAEPTGELWIRILDSLWQYLDSYPRLGVTLRPRWGIQWTIKQTKAFSERRQPGFREGLASARHLKQFRLNRSSWLDFRPDFLRNGYDQDWDRPKLIINEGRLSRGPWRIGAAVDTKGLLFSQQFFGLWPVAPLAESELLALSAVVNGPVANAFIAIHSPAKGIRASAVAQIPIPPSLPDKIGDFVAEYSNRLANRPVLGDDDEDLAALLTRIDAAVLEAYDLPPRLEYELLEYFRGAKRPVVHEWTHWNESRPEAFLINTLAPEPIDVIHPIPATVAPCENEYCADFSEANLAAFGDSREEAVANLKDIIAITFLKYVELGETALGPGPAREYGVLRRFLRKRSR